MKTLQDIIESVLQRGKSTEVIHDDDIDDWEPDSDVFHRLDEAKPVKPMKPLKPGETREDSEIKSDPNHEESDDEMEDDVPAEIKDAAEKDAREVEKTAPRSGNAVNDLVNLANQKDIPKVEKGIPEVKK